VRTLNAPVRPAVGLTRHGGRPRLRRQQAGFALCARVAGLALIALFVIAPALQTVRYSFYRWDGYSPDMAFVGLRMYQQAVDALGFPEAVRNSLIWGDVALVVPTGGRPRGRGARRGQQAAPEGALPLRLLPPLLLLHGGRRRDLRPRLRPELRDDQPVDPDRRRRRGAAVAGGPLPRDLGGHRVFVWHETAFCFIVFAAAIQQLDRELYAAARIDGANALQVFRDVTVPGLRQIATFVMTIMLIGGLTPFAVVFALTTPGLGGPYYATEVLPTLIFKAGLQGTNIGQSAALGVMLLVVVLSITLAFSWVRDRVGGEA
jgi:ABC-type sugar transport system permease subunit